MQMHAGGLFRGYQSMLCVMLLEVRKGRLWCRNCSILLGHQRAQTSLVLPNGHEEMRSCLLHVPVSSRLDSMWPWHKTGEAFRRQARNYQQQVPIKKCRRNLWSGKCCFGKDVRILSSGWETIRYELRQAGRKNSLKTERKFTWT